MERAVVAEFHAGGDLDAAERSGRGAVEGRGDVPEVGGVLLAAGEDGPAVGAEGDEPDLALVAERRADRPAGGLVPELGGPVVAAGQDGPAVGADRQGAELAVVAERAGRSAGRSAASQSRAIRSQPPVITVRPSGLKAATETGPSWWSGADAEPAGGGVPEPGLHVVAAGQDGPAVGAEGHGHDPAPVPERASRRAGRSAASQSRAVLSSAAGQGGPAVGAEGDRADRPVVAEGRADRLRRWRRPRAAPSGRRCRSGRSGRRG